MCQGPPPWSMLYQPLEAAQALKVNGEHTVRRVIANARLDCSVYLKTYSGTSSTPQ